MELIIAVVLFALIVASWLFLPGALDSAKPAPGQSVVGSAAHRST